jgi:hypothetical protein
MQKMNTNGKKPFQWPAWMKSDLFLNLWAAFLWLLSAVFSFYVLLESQQTLLRHLADGESVSRWGFQVVRQWTTIILVGIWLAFTIITGEFHYQQRRKPLSWRVFKWSYLCLGLVALLALVL